MESNSMGKNVTIYLPDDVAEKMESFPEVNWSEVCRRAVLEYIQIRSQVDLGPIIERLKKERNVDFKEGQITMYKEIIPKLSWKDFELWRTRVDRNLIEQQHGPFGEEPIGPLAAERAATDGMRRWIRQFAKENKIQIQEDLSDAFCEGAIDAFMDIYNRTKRK
jgi:hypothetical protein